MGQRDYAILLVLARLGLRAGEVAHLELDDIDWEKGEIRVRGKSIRHDRLPLPRDVGEALAGMYAKAVPALVAEGIHLHESAATGVQAFPCYL